MTRLAPSSIGRQMSGAKVLSTTSGIPASRATAASPGRSATRSKRVGEGLDEDRPGGGLRSAAGGPGVGRVEDVVADPPPRQLPRDQRAGPAINAVGEQDVVPLPEQVQERRGDRPHARGADQPGLGPLEPGELLGELGRVGMAVARVDEAAGRAVVQGVDVCRIGRAVDDAQLDRRDQRPAARIGGPGRAAQSVEGCGSRGFVDIRRIVRASSGPVASTTAHGLAVEPRPRCRAGDDLADLAEGDPVVAGGPRLGLLAAEAGEQGPVDRPGLLDGLLLGGPGQLVEPDDQVLVDRAIGRPVQMLLDAAGSAARFRALSRSPRAAASSPLRTSPSRPAGASGCCRISLESGSIQGPIRTIRTVMLSRPPRRLARLTR